MAKTEGPDKLRDLATDYARAKRWADLLALEPDLRADREYWPLAPQPLAGPAGDHRFTVAIKTPYSTLAPQPLHYVIR
jgi:hypothetical protein